MKCSCGHEFEPEIKYRHRLICGDCTDADVVARVMGEEKAQLMVTDPPYGISLDHTWRDEIGINRLGKAESNMVVADDRASWEAAFELSKVDIAYVWHAHQKSPIIYNDLEECGFEVRQQVVWVKNLATMGRSAYHWQHESCWYAVREGASASWCGGRDQTTVWEAPSPKHIMGGSDEDKQPHPTQKPIITAERAITNHDVEIVYDPFLGSGTTLIACERLTRHCRAVEIEPKYVAVALERWHDMTGEEPKLVDAELEQDKYRRKLAKG